jgi:predicted nuclease of predicted toxin-antitoxin system
MASIYANENFPLQVVEHLRALGHDVLTSHDAGQANQAIPDGDVLDFADKSERILVTLNRRDFILLNRQRSDHAGIVVCTVDTDFSGQARRVHEALNAAGEMRGKLVRVNRPG